MQSVAGKVALVTGGAGGIGLGMAQAFLAAGMKVAIADVDAQALADAEATLKAVSDAVLPLVFDVRDAAAWTQAVDTVERTLGPVQVLCNNAGVTTPVYSLKRGTFEQQTLAEWRWALGVNLDGPFLGTCTVLPRLRASGLDGHIVNTSSMAGVIPFPGMPPAYAASKFGVVGLSEELRLDLHLSGPHNVGVSVLFPGHTRSRIQDSSLALSPDQLDGEEPEFLQAVRKRLAAGTDPRLMGERVLRAILANEFYIFSHPEYRAVVERHLAKIAAAFGDAADPTRQDPMPAQA